MTRDGEDPPSVQRVQPRRVTKMKAQRFLSGYTQGDMARKLGITQATYNRIENEVDETTDERLEQIAEILGLSKDELFDQTDLDQAGEKRWHAPSWLSKTKKQQPERAPSHETQLKEMEQADRVNPRDIPALLKELKELVDAGVITQAEFETKKKELLARL